MTIGKTKEPTLATSTVDVITAIRYRRSIRSYTGEPVSEVALNTILQAGLCAPTARNRRPFHFVMVKNRETLRALAAGKVHAHMLVGAYCAIVVCGDNVVEDRPEFLYADCFAATQNILLAIHGLDLGGVWLGVGTDSEWQQLINELLKLPPNIVPTAVVALGHPAEEKLLPATWETQKIHPEKWSSS